MMLEFDDQQYGFRPDIEGDLPQFAFTTSVLDGLPDDTYLLDLRVGEGVDAFSVVRYISRDSDETVTIQCEVTEQDGEPFIELALEIDRPPIAKWMKKLDNSQIARQWRMFTSVYNVYEGYSIDRLDTGKLESLRAVLTASDDKKRQKIRLTVAAEPESDSDAPHVVLNPARYFEDPILYFESLSDQLCALHGELQQFLIYGPVAHRESYEILCGTARRDLPMIVRTKNGVDRIGFSLDSPLTVGADIPVSIEIRDSLIEPGVVLFDMVAALPDDVGTQLAGKSFDDINLDWLEHNAVLEKADLRSDLVFSDTWNEIGFTFSQQKTESKNNKKGYTLRLTQREKGDPMSFVGIPVAEYFDSTLTWFTESWRLLKNQTLPRMSAFLAQHDVQYPFTWRLLAEDANFTYSQDNEAGYDHLQSEIHELSDYFHGTINVYLRVEQSHHYKDGEVMVQASCDLGEIEGIPDIGYIDASVYRDLWNKYLEGKFILGRSDIVAKKKKERRIRVVPDVVMHDSGLPHLFLRVVEELRDGTISSVWSASEYNNTYPQSVISALYGAMNQTAWGVTEFHREHLEGMARKYFAKKGRYDPWVLQAIHERTISRVAEISIRDNGIAMQYSEKSVQQGIVGTVRFKDIPGEHDVMILYDPEQTGIDIRVVVPNTIFTDNKDINLKHLEEAVINLTRVFQEFSLFPDDEFLVKGFEQSCKPVFEIIDKKNRNPKVILKMQVNLTELMVLHEVGRGYWDELIIEEMFDHLRLAMAAWLKRLTDFSTGNEM